MPYEHQENPDGERAAWRATFHTDADHPASTQHESNVGGGCSSPYILGAIAIRLQLHQSSPGSFFYFSTTRGYSHSAAGSSILAYSIGEDSNAIPEKYNVVEVVILAPSEASL